MNKLLILGGSGLFGKSIVDCALRKKLVKHKISKIYIVARKKFKNKRIKNKYIEINFISKNFKDIKKIPESDYIIYCIKTNSITKSHLYFEKFKNIISKFKKKPKILFTSSGAVYGKISNKTKLSENIKINYKKIMQFTDYKKKYALEKVYIENMFKGLGKLNFNVSIGRCFNFVGKYVLNSNQAIADMINDGLKKNVIKLNTSINVYRGYLNTDDLVNWLLVILKKSNRNCPIYNVGSDKEINLKSLGKKIAKIFNKKLKSKVAISKKTDYYVPSINKAKKMLKLKISISLNDSLNSFIKLK